MPAISFSFDESTRIKAYEALERTKKEVEDDVQIITKWLETQPHIPELLSTAKIRNFLVLNKFSIEKTKHKIDMYYTIRSLIPDWFDASNPKLPKMKMCTKNTLLCLHPKLVDELYRVCFLKVLAPGHHTPRETSIQYFNVMEIRLEEDCMIGDVVIFDCVNLAVEDYMRITPVMAQKYFAIYQKVFSIRIKALYFINASSAVLTVMKIIEKIIKPKIFKRVHVCKDAEVLKEVFARDILPKDYGGNGPSLQELSEIMISKFEEYQDRFDALDSLRIDESLRPEKLQNDEDLGFYGNFKTLEID